VITVRRLRKQYGLKSTRQQKHTMDSIYDRVREIRERFPFRGANAIRKNLRVLHGDRVPRDLVLELLNIVEPDAVKERRHRRLRRRRFWTAGVNDVWPQDQHDKWGRFGIWLHASLEAFSGEINWLRVWWTNKNPKLIAGYFINKCRTIGAVPVLTQSDPGHENHGVANSQTTIRHSLDPSLAGTMQHRFANGHNNILSEIKWSVFRRDFSPGFENILEEGVREGWYDVDDILENLLFRWLAFPWLQAEIDEWVRFKNETAPRADRNKVLPHGIPALIRAKPEHYGGLDFKIPVSPELFDQVEAQFAPQDDPVFQLVPPLFDARANDLYLNIGQPVVASDTLWTIFRQLLEQFRTREEDVELLDTLAAYEITHASLRDEKMLLLANMQPFRNGQGIVGPKGSQYAGGLVQPPAKMNNGVCLVLYINITTPL